MIGKLEEIVLLATVRCGANAMPSGIYERIVETVPNGEKSPAFGAVYTTITRMAAKGMLTESTVTDDRGRSRKAFSVSASGMRSLSFGLQQSAALGGYVMTGALA